MAANNIILAVPSANSTVNYDLPDNESATLSFAPEDISGLNLDANGGLVISFIEGGNVTLTNFQSFVDKGNTLSLSDGTNVDPKLLFNALGGQNDNPFPGADVTKIGIPSENAQKDITLESGKKYLFDFDLSQTQGADVKDGKMVINFANGGKIVIPNYETAMAEKNPPELSLASKTCVVSGDELITNIQALAVAPAAGETVVVEEEIEEEAKQKSKIAAADMEGKGDIGPGDETALGYRQGEVKEGEGKSDDSGDAALSEAKARDANEIKTAAGEDAIAAQLASIETAAGGPAGGRSNSGYGYGSRPGSDPFVTNPDIGPINPTQLNYQAPILTPSEYVDLGDEDSTPEISPATKSIDETDLENGPISVSGTINVDFGADGPGSVKPNGSFTSGGSQTGDLLSSNGEPITVEVVGNKYVGTTAGGDVAFELVIENDGDYTFTQFLPLDHADGSDANDQITLNFGVIARDGDGDPISTKIKIIIADDAPEIEGASGTVDETDLGPNPITVGGTLAHDFNEDGPGTIEATGQFSSGGSQLNGNLTSGGVAVDVTSTPNGYVGTANGVTIFTLTLDAAGNYTYTQYKNLDHADANNPNDEITLTFGAKIIDFDGDTDTAPIIITIRDDAPTFQPPEDPENPPEEPPVIPGNPTPDHGLEIVDETGLKPGPLVETGTLDADFGSDVPGSYGFKPGSFASSGSKTDGDLTHNGVPVVVTLNNGVWTGVAGDKTIFTLALNTSTGGYTYTQYDNFDHADGNDPNDQIVLDFGVAASDFDGDSADGSIRIIVKDDAPVANDDVNTYDTTFGVANGNVITGVNGGPGAADNLSSDSDTTAQQNSVVKIAFGDNEVDVPATGTVSIDGEYGTLTIAADGTYTYKAFEDGDMVVSEEKEFVSGPALPDFDEGQALDGVEQQSLGIAPGNLAVEAGDVVTVKYVGEQAGYSNTLGVFTITADGTLKAETILIKSSDQATAGQSFSYTAANNAVATGFFLLADAANTYAAFDGIDLNVGRLDFVYNYGQPGEREAKATDDGANIKLVYTDIEGNETVVDAPMYFTSDRGSVDNLNADGSVRVVSGIPGDDNTVLRVGFEDLPGLGDKDFNDMVFDVSIKGKDCGCGDDNIKDVFTYTLKDGDGDTDKATLTLNGQDLTDDQPILTAPAAQTVDETNLKDGVPTQTGTIDVDFGHDGPGTVDPNGSFNSTGSRLDGKLTSGGVPVVVSVVGDTYVGKAGDNTVFTLQIKDDGTYTFKLLDNLDHADGSNPDDIITLKFGAEATDCDGDKSSTTVVIHVKDDAPVAHNDNRSLDEGQTINGNVTNNDVPGQDTPATVTKVEFNGTPYIVPANGTSITITGDHGVLTIDKTGAYTYKSNSDGTDNFKYTLTDRDGDSDKAILSICSDDIDTTPTIVKPGQETVDETNLKDGNINEGGTITADFKDDGPGSFGGNGSFSSGGSKLGGNLTHNGVAVDVTLVGNTYVGKAGDTTVFTLVVNSNGSYNFTLLEQLDHADGSNPNDEISLNFGIDAIDADGDKASTTLTINVRDDAPVAKNDSNSAGEGQTVTGNVTKNDSPGQDTPATVTKVSFNGTSYDVPASGKLVIQGAYGKLTIDQTGAYSYTAKSNNPNGTDNFVYTLKDNDGDTDTACLSIDVTCTDDKPTITAAIETVDETSLSSGTITETGSVTANYFSDGPGSISGNNTFTSTGSKLGGNLTHNGTLVVVSYDKNTGTYTGVAGSVTVFTLAITSTGAYTFKLFEQLDHADGNNPNDVINLNFGVVATDADGDKATSTITVKVKDDAPVANDDHNTADTNPATGNVITGLNGGPGAKDDLSQDVANKVVKVSFDGKTVDVPATGTATIEGNNGVLRIAADGSYTYTAKPGSSSTGEEKTFVGGPALPDFDESEALDGVEKQSLGVAKGNLSVGEGDVITVKFVGEQAGYSNTLGIFTVDASGKLKAETIVIKNSDTANNAPHSYTAGEGSVATGFFIIADGATINKNYSGIDLTKGSLDFVYKYGTGSAREATISDNGADVKLVYTAENGTKTVINGPMYFTSDRGDISSLNADGTVRVVSGLPNEHDNTVLRVGFEDLPCLGDKDYNDVVFDIAITNADCKCDNADVFTYTLKDGDGDTDTATLTVDCAAPLPITVDIKADDVCVKEDSSIKLPVSANFLNGTGNETMTLTLSGVKEGWKVTGWTDTGNGTYTLVLPKGQSSYSGELTFKPPANSDADLTGLVFKASVYDPDTKQTTTDTDGAKVIVDAVVDDFSFNAGVQEHNSSTGKVFVLTKKDLTINAKIDITDLTRPDADGSESLKKIVFTIADGMDDTTFISVKNANGTFTKVGVKGSAGSDTTYTIDLSGMTYAQAKDYITNKLYLTNTGKSGLNGNYNLGIQIVSYEKNLSGIEKDYSDNQTSHSVCLPIMFCISPLVIDLDRDGVELTNLDTNPVLFDITNDGVKDKTGWAGKDDGLLALDRNKDGKINDRSELFGNDDTHDNGFAALAAYDLNKDGKIDKNDAVFKDLKVWQDKNGDGISQASELKSLKDLKIASIDLHAKDVAYDIAGNPVTHESTVVYEDGSKSDIVDAWFAYKDGTATGVDKGLTLMGTEGADLLAGTNGQDTLYGGAGGDTFLFQTISEAVDTVKDFNVADGDKIDLSQMLNQFDPVTDAITDFVFATVKDGNTILAVNDNGTGSAGAHAVAVLENVDVSVADLLKNGSIVV